MPQQSLNRKKMSAGGALVAVLVAIYVFAQPILNERFGWNLPAVSQPSDSPPLVVERPKLDSGKQASSSPSGQPSSQDATTNLGRHPQSDDQVDQTKKDSSLRYGLLRETTGNRFVSPAGLLYTPGSQEGHRLEHLKRHTADQPQRPGSHGVFDGGMEQTLQVLDEAYRRTKKGEPGVVKRTERGRTVVTVDMKRRIGFIGGKTGNRKRKPMARRVRLVLDGSRLITAYPVN